jgi:hypothetical protein
MPDINYNRDFIHKDWRDNEDIVQAEGENGFNEKFHAIEDEFDKITTISSEVSSEFTRLESVIEEINSRPLPGLKVQSVVTLSKVTTPSQVTEPEEIETYANADFPEGIKKVYQVSIQPFPNNHGQVSYHLIYEPASDSTTRVSIWFKNERDLLTRFRAQILSLS